MRWGRAGALAETNKKRSEAHPVKDDHVSIRGVVHGNCVHHFLYVIVKMSDAAAAK